MINTRIFLNANRWFGVARTSSDVSVPLPYPNAGNVINYYLPAIGFDSNGRLITEGTVRNYESDGNALSMVRIPVYQGSTLISSDAAGTVNYLSGVDAINTDIGMTTNQLVPGQYYSVVADGFTTNHVVTHGFAGGNAVRQHQPGDVFLATTLDTANSGTNYVISAGSPKVTLFSGVEVSKLTGRVKVAKTRVSD
jgi:hypothetical protein